MPKNVPSKKQFLLLGLGRFGQSVAKSLVENGCEVLGCDRNPDVVEEVSQYAVDAVQADISDELALAALGLDNFDAIVIAAGQNLAASVLATLSAKEKGAKKIVVKAQNEREKRILLKVGADRVVLPEWEMGVKVAAELSSANILDYINLADGYGIAEIEPLPQWVGLTLQKADIRAKTDITIVAVKRGGRVIVSPKPGVVIEKTDILVAIGEDEDLQNLGVHNPAD